MQQLDQTTNYESIRSNLKNTLNFDIIPTSAGQILQIQENIITTYNSQVGEISVVTQRKFGKDRLKMIINFTEEEQLKPVIQQGEIHTQYKNFEQKYKLGDKVGEGAHAIVRKANKHSKNGIIDHKIYAVKIFRSGDPEIINTIKKTYNNSRFLNHPSIAAAIELFINEKTENAYLVMEYCPFPSLEDVIKKLIKLPEPMIQGIAHDLLTAVGFIHQKGICHRDIKPDNILMDDSGHINLMSSSKIKLVDFGVSKRFLQIIPGKVGSHTMDMWTCTGNIHYCAPEIYNGGGYNASIDVWAVGVVLYQCLTGCLPFHENSQMDTIDAIGNENGKHFQASGFKDASKIFQDFIKRLLKTDPKQRITVEEALEHPFITSVNYNRLKSDSFKSRDDGDIQIASKQTKEMLTKSSQMGELNYSKHYLSHPTSQIKEEVDECSPTFATREIAQNKKQLEQKLEQFKQDTQLTRIHTVKRPEEYIFGQIDLVSSFNTYANANRLQSSPDEKSTENQIGLFGKSCLQFPSSLIASSEYDACEDHTQVILDGFDYQIQSSMVLSEQAIEKHTQENFDILSLECEILDEHIVD